MNSASTSSLDSGTTFGSTQSSLDGQYLAQVLPLDHRFREYKVIITPAKAFTTQFYCNGYRHGSFDVYSNLVPISVTAEPSPTPHMKVTASTNVSTVAVGQPFTLTCKVADFVPGKEYFVINYYYNITNYPFADYIVLGTVFSVHFFVVYSRNIK